MIQQFEDFINKNSTAELPVYTIPELLTDSTFNIVHSKINGPWMQTKYYINQIVYDARSPVQKILQ